MIPTIYALLLFAIIAAVWHMIPTPEPLKLIVWLILAFSFIVQFLIPLL